MNLDELLHSLQTEIGLRSFALENLKVYQRLGESAVKSGDRYRADLQLQNVKDQCKKIVAIEAEIGRLCGEVAAQFPKAMAAKETL